MITPCDSGLTTRRRESLKQEARNSRRPGRIFLEVQYLKRRIFLDFFRYWGYGKTDLVHLVSKRLSLTNYLELCTSTTRLR